VRAPRRGAVDDEVRLSDLLDDDRREDRGGNRRREAVQAVAQRGTEGVELAVEVAAAVLRPDDLRDLDRPDAGWAIVEPETADRRR
jgi:hypothetical protein